MHAQARFISVLTTLTVLFLASQEGHASTRYATPTGLTTGSCLDWANACTMQRAITAAGSGDQIWATKGTYKAAVCVSNNCVCTSTCASDAPQRANSFILKNNVRIYGGFDGTETALYLRDADPDPYTANPSTDSILSGDLNGNDTGTDPTHGTRAENSYNVVKAQNTTRSARLDGFTVIGGNDADSSFYAGGAGIRLESDQQVTIWGCSILSNRAAGGGGGLYSPGDDEQNGGSWIVNTVFAYNVSTHGGAIGTKTHWTHRIFNSEFVENTTSGQGGALYMAEGTGGPLIVNTLFARNHANDSGGVLYTTGEGVTVEFRNCTMADNSANQGGAIATTSKTPSINTPSDPLRLARPATAMKRPFRAVGASPRTSPSCARPPMESSMLSPQTPAGVAQSVTYMTPCARNPPNFDGFDLLCVRSRGRLWENS